MVVSTPTDCIRIIVSYAGLKERYTWSLVDKYFAFTQEDWQYFGQLYKTREKTRECIKELCQRHFDAQFLFKQCDRHMWSFHLNEPLCLWSPWTLGKLCKRYNKACSMTFRNYAFVDFGRNFLTKRSRSLMSVASVMDLPDVKNNCLTKSLWFIVIIR